MTSAPDQPAAPAVVVSHLSAAWPATLRCAAALHVAEDACQVFTDGRTVSVAFAPMFPAPRVERVAPGHLVVVATSGEGRRVIVWRWYDAVVLADDDAGVVTLWEPAHGVVNAQRRKTDQRYRPGRRAYLSAGLPGADWWVAGPADGDPEEADVELADVDRLYVDNRLWERAFAEETDRTGGTA